MSHVVPRPPPSAIQKDPETHKANSAHKSSQSETRLSPDIRVIFIGIVMTWKLIGERDSRVKRAS